MYIYIFFVCLFFVFFFSFWLKIKAVAVLVILVARNDPILFAAGCQLIMKHAVHKGPRCLVQVAVKDHIKDYPAFKSQLNLQSKQVAKFEEDFDILKDQDGRLNEHGELIDVLHEELKALKALRAESKAWKRLVFFEEQSSVCLQAREQRVHRLEQSHSETAGKVEEFGRELKSLKTQMDKPGRPLLHPFTKNCG